MKFEKTEVWGFEHAVRGMRNPYDSWDKSDSEFKVGFSGNGCILGENDLKLMQKLIKGGSEHRKFLRQIFVSVDITAPLYWWKEFDTYKIGTVSNSCSTMHTLVKNPITQKCFEIDDYKEVCSINEIWLCVIKKLEELRKKFLDTQNKMYWKEMIRLLPQSYLQKRTITMNYENVFSMVNQRMNHKLIEWSGDFLVWAMSLPYSKELIFEITMNDRGKNGTV